MSLKSRIEAVLFVTGKAVTIEEIAKILETDEAETESAMLDLIYDYSSREGALEIDDENGYIIQVKEEYSDIINKCKNGKGNASYRNFFIGRTFCVGSPSRIHIVP